MRAGIEIAGTPSHPPPSRGRCRIALVTEAVQNHRSDTLPLAGRVGEGEWLAL